MTIVYLLAFLAAPVVLGAAVYLAGRRLRIVETPVERHKAEVVILAELRKGPSYGLALIAAAPGVLHQGNVYPILRDLEARGIVESEECDGGLPCRGGRPRRCYRMRTISSPTPDDEPEPVNPASISGIRSRRRWIRIEAPRETLYPWDTSGDDTEPVLCLACVSLGSGRMCVACVDRVLVAESGEGGAA